MIGIINLRIRRSINREEKCEKMEFQVDSSKSELIQLTQNKRNIEKLMKNELKN